MERLTVRPPESDEACLSCEKCGKKAISECWDEMDCQQTALERLAAIEDILGDDYDLDRLRELCNQRMTLREDVAVRMELVGNIPMDRLRELVEADRDGRCVVLPCKVGDKMQYIESDESIGYEIVEKIVVEIETDGGIYSANELKPEDFKTPGPSEAAQGGDTHG